MPINDPLYAFWCVSQEQSVSKWLHLTSPPLSLAGIFMSQLLEHFEESTYKNQTSWVVRNYVDILLSCLYWSHKLLSWDGSRKDCYFPKNSIKQGHIHGNCSLAFFTYCSSLTE